MNASNVDYSRDFLSVYGESIQSATTISSKWPVRRTTTTRMKISRPLWLHTTSNTDRQRTIWRSDRGTIARGVRLGNDANDAPVGTRTVEPVRGHCCFGTAMLGAKWIGTISSDRNIAIVGRRGRTHKTRRSSKFGANGTPWYWEWFDTTIAGCNLISHEGDATNSW